MKLFGLGAFSWRLITIDSTLGLFRLSVSLCVNFGRLCLSQNWSVSSQLSNLWIQSFS